MRITKLIAATTLLGLALARQTSAEPDRFNEYVVVQQHVPHKVTRRWPIFGEKIGVDLVVERGSTDKQLVEVVKWYVSVRATTVFIYDNDANASKRVMPLAMYMDNDLTRFRYRNDELIKMTKIELSP
jgi:hypothetical protein